MALTKTPICDFNLHAIDFKLKSVENTVLSLNDIKGENGTLIMFICNHCPYVKAVTKDIAEDTKKLKDLGIPNEMQYRDMYSEQTGKDLSQDWEFYMIYSLFKVAAICQGILGRVRDGTAASNHAEERGMNVFPLSKGAWSIVESNF